MKNSLEKFNLKKTALFVKQGRPPNRNAADLLGRKFNSAFNQLRHDALSQAPILI